ncbi:MAG: transcription repressor NadR [Thermoanaerobacterium sp.]|nr:transcription repressor NadR [Thermoanaerobacterium sp.]
MNSAERRDRILDILKAEEGPVKGNRLADILGVTRQIIVQDIAILRAEGIKILSTPQGYILSSSDKGKYTKVIASKHYFDRTEEELNTIVDNGGKVLDVIVEHPLYGEIRGLLMISSRYDVERFMDSVENGKATLLSSLTEGVHLHTIEADSKEVLDRIEKKLKEKGFFVE